ncbi:MAG: hypothetical protein CVU38_20650 [Chloroflexi bacterium HGW-Chloroflexi-1]|nr:MAG: hypothetical protein CVU38_20650 [Chloroflexi bacterium HGW-Chloroflexi-1]
MLNREYLLQRIVVDPRVLAGKPTIRGLRISVEQILAALTAGVPMADLFQDYPELEAADIQAALAYALERVSEERVYALAAVA